MARLIVFFMNIFINFGVLANDGFSAIEAGGIVFKKTDNITMEKEELFISKGKILVKYLFKNNSDKDIKTTISFPLPPKTCGWFSRRELIEGFSAKVNGKTIELSKQVKAIENKKSPEVLPFGTGKDISSIVEKAGLPLDCSEVYKNPKLFKIAKANNLAEDYKEEDPEHVQFQTEVIYHWDQVFKAGESLVIEHEYVPLTGMGLGYCPVAKNTLEYKYFKIATKGEPSNPKGNCHIVKYILTTANTWSGPIKDFKLEVDYSDSIIEIWSNYEGLKYNKDTKKLELHKKNYSPSEELTLGLWVPNSWDL